MQIQKLPSAAIENIMGRRRNRWLKSRKTQAAKKAQSCRKFATRIARNEIAEENRKEMLANISGKATKPERVLDRKEEIAFRKNRRMKKA